MVGVMDFGQVGFLRSTPMKFSSPYRAHLATKVQVRNRREGERSHAYRERKFLRESAPGYIDALKSSNREERQVLFARFDRKRVRITHYHELVSALKKILEGKKEPWEYNSSSLNMKRLRAAYERRERGETDVEANEISDACLRDLRAMIGKKKFPINLGARSLDLIA